MKAMSYTYTQRRRPGDAGTHTEASPQGPSLESLRSGAARPRENGAQAATLGAPNYRSMSRQQREELRRRIYAAGAQGGHLPAGG